MPELQIGRRRFLTLSAASLAACTFASRSRGQPPTGSSGVGGDLVWHEVCRWGVEGRGWDQTERYYDRLPAKAQGVVTDKVWERSRFSAGMCARFETDSTTIAVRYKLLVPRLAFPHMPATSVSGVDLYAADDQRRWRWVNVAQPEGLSVEFTLGTALDSGRRTYLLYLPLYNGVDGLEIGVSRAAAFGPIAPRRDKPLVFYGTSITQGASVSRPGLAYPAVLGRRFARPTINLGFSGNGKMHPEMADLLTELDPIVYVIDCLPNMEGPLVAERAEPLVRRLRAARPETPIVLVEDRSFTNAPFFPALRSWHAGNREALKTAYQHLTAAGVKNLHYVAGEHLLGDDSEGAADGEHPNDLGMTRLTDALAKVLAPLLPKAGQA